MKKALQPRHRELEVAFFVIIILSGVYVAYDILAEPAGGHPFGHILGIVGTLLMVMTELLYSLRKRTRLLNWAGPVRWWLSFHIVTGLVGPFLVLMHTGLQFRGLAGITAFLTLIVVASGFVGRYLYTAIHGNIRTQAIALDQGNEHIMALTREISAMERRKPVTVQLINMKLQAQYPQDTWWSRRQYRRHLKKSLYNLENAQERKQQELAASRRRQSRTRGKITNLEQSRQYFQFWHTVHIPIGLTLFTAVAIHIVVTLIFRAGLFK